MHKATLDRERLAHWLSPGDAVLVVSAPPKFTRLPCYRRGYLNEYARDHHVEDFLRCTAEAVNRPVF